MRSRRPAPAVVFHRWAVNSVLHGTVLSLSVTTFAFDFFFLPLTVALRMWMPTLVSFCGVIAAFQVLPPPVMRASTRARGPISCAVEGR